jgi:hypothetical protein
MKKDARITIFIVKEDVVIDIIILFHIDDNNYNRLIRKKIHSYFYKDKESGKILRYKIVVYIPNCWYKKHLHVTLGPLCRYRDLKQKYREIDINLDFLLTMFNDGVFDIYRLTPLIEQTINNYIFNI